LPKKKLGTAKEVAKEKLEDAKDAAFVWVSSVKSLEGVQEKASEIAESARDTLKGIVGQESLDAAKEKVNDITVPSSIHTLERLQTSAHVKKPNSVYAHTTKEHISQAAYDHARRRGALDKTWQIFPDLSIRNNRLDNNTSASRLASLVYRIKSGLLQDEEVRRALSFKAEWDKIDFQQRTDIIVQQLRILGDDVVEEVVHKLDSERCAKKCLDYEGQQMCPK